MFCRKRTFLVLYMIFLLLFMVTDMIYISFLAILLHNMKSSSLALGLQDLYSSALLQINYGDVQGSRTDWWKMFKTLGCCGVTSAINRFSVCSNSVPKNACWEKFSDTMTTYCSTYMTLASLSFILQIMQLSICDVIYSQLSDKKLPFALARSCIEHVQISWKRSWHLTLINTCRLLSCISAIALVVLGSMLLRDDRMTGYFVHPIYSILYVFGVNFTDIIKWFGIIMIVIGATELIFSIVAMISDAKMPEKRFRHILFVVIYIIMLIPKILWLAVCTKLISKMREDLRSKMEYSLRHNYYNIRRSWMYLFGELECCGVSSSDDICTYGITSSCSLYPYTCFFSLYETGDYQIESNHEVSYITSNLRKMGCLEKILDIFQFYSIGFFVTISFTISLVSLVILLTLIRLKSIYSSENNNVSSEEDKLVKHDEKQLRKKFLNYCKSDYSRVIILITTILCMIFGLVLVAEGVVLAFDQIFNHKIIKQALFSNLRFEGVSFNQIRESLYVFMIAMGTALVIFCGFGYFTLGTRSRSLHVSQAVIVSIILVFMITGVCLWGKTKDSISYQMDIQMLEHASTYNYYDYLFIDNPDGISAWSNLFAEAECCGVNVHDRMEFWPGFGRKFHYIAAKRIL
uniref:Uncharacterized protein LOC111130895 n=1 Tax=Crassostrea virginica TaxID=6565 RepID=A0A8B8E3I9_CRAVI|nr:uncharacterized protein LOC111130895 [Crassostrea virginica]XP_022333875.1 uncharacterized protein LOC111130895 [Crassostrea virginica]XP_022333876.1 uncharacterized protein LOC111130895 [Crassostrea virginica]